MIGPRAVLMSSAPGFMRWSSGPAMSPVVSAFNRQLTETTSDSSSSVSRETRRAPASAARSSVRVLPVARMSMSKARPMRATLAPMRPRPITPRVRPSSSMPTAGGQAPSRMPWATSGIFLASASSNAKVSSTVEAPESLGVTDTTMPRRVASATSRCGMPRPIWEMKRSDGARANSRSRNGERSRMSTTAWASPTAADHSSSVVSLRSTTSTSASPAASS